MRSMKKRGIKPPFGMKLHRWPNWVYVPGKAGWVKKGFLQTAAHRTNTVLTRDRLLHLSLDMRYERTWWRKMSLSDFRQNMASSFIYEEVDAVYFVLGYKLIIERDRKARLRRRRGK